MKSQSTTEDDTPFNFAMLYYIGLTKLLDAIGRAAIMDNIPLWYKGLRALYRRIFFKIKDDERTKLNDMFKEVKTGMNTNVGNGSVGDQMTFFIMSDAATKLDEIECEIMVLLNKYKMIFPNIDSTKGLDKLLDKYNLEGKK